MPTSSTVWWASTCEVARRLDVRSNPPWRPSCSSMWSKNGRPVETPAWPRPSSTSVTSIAGLLGGALRCWRRRTALRHRLSFRAARKRSFSSAVPTVTRRQPRRPCQLAQLRIRTELSRSARQTSSASRSRRAEQDEVGVGRPGLDGRSARAAATRPRSSAMRATRRLHLGHVAQGQQAGHLVCAESGTAARPPRTPSPRRGRRPGSRGAAPAMAQVLEKVRVTTSPGCAGPRELERRPRGELPVGLVDDDEARCGCAARRRPSRTARRRPVGLFGEHRNVTSGCSVGQHGLRVCGIDAEVVVARALDHRCAGEPRDVRVQRVGGLEHRARRPGPPKASRRHCSTSLDPLAQKTSSGDTPCRSATAWRSSVAGRSG